MNQALDLPSARAALTRCDGRIAALIEAFGPIEMEPERDCFKSLVSAIIAQQLHWKVAETIFERFNGIFPGAGFPAPDEVLNCPREALQTAGLSRRKAEYIHNLAGRIKQGKLDPELLLRMSDEEVRASLTAIKGIGPWTVDMFLIFTLARPDVFPAGDLGIQKGYQLLYQLDQLPEPRWLETRALKWKPYRTVAALYLWKLAEEGLP